MRVKAEYLYAIEAIHDYKESCKYALKRRLCGNGCTLPRIKRPVKWAQQSRAAESSPDRMCTTVLASKIGETNRSNQPRATHYSATTQTVDQQVENRSD